MSLDRHPVTLESFPAGSDSVVTVCASSSPYDSRRLPRPSRIRERPIAYVWGLDMIHAVIDRFVGAGHVGPHDSIHTEH